MPSSWMLSPQRQQWKEAEAYFQQALHIYIDFHNRYAQAGTYPQLKLVMCSPSFIKTPFSLHDDGQVHPRMDGAVEFEGASGREGADSG